MSIETYFEKVLDVIMMEQHSFRVGFLPKYVNSHRVHPKRSPDLKDKFGNNVKPVAVTLGPVHEQWKV